MSQNDVITPFAGRLLLCQSCHTVVVECGKKMISQQAWPGNGALASRRTPINEVHACWCLTTRRAYHG